MGTPRMLPTHLMLLAALVLTSPTLLADTITLVGGDVLHGIILEEREEFVVLQHAELGRLELSRGTIASFAHATPDAGASAAPAITTPPVTPVVAQAPASPPTTAAAPSTDAWRFKFDLGFTGSTNDGTSNWDLRTAAEAVRATTTRRTTISGEYYFQYSDGIETDNNLSVKGLEEFLFEGSRWEAFVQATYQNDNFQAWEQRIGGYAGPSYRLIEEGPLALKLRGGAGASYELSSATWTPELLFGDELVWAINAKSKLKQGLELYPDIDRVSEYRLIFRVDYEVAISEKGDVKATAGVRSEFDSFVPEDGGTANDLKVYAGLQFVF